MVNLYEAASDAIHGFEIIAKAFKSNQKFDLKERHPDFQMRAFEYAAQSGSLLTLSLLITHEESDFNILKDGINLLVFAEQNPNPEIALYVNNLLGGELHKAVLLGHIEKANELIDADIERALQTNLYYQTPLYYAGALGLTAILIHFLRHPNITSMANTQFNDMYLGCAHYAKENADLYLQNKENSKALVLYNEAIYQFMQIHTFEEENYRLLAHCYFNRGVINFNKNDLKSALNNFENVSKVFLQVTAQNDFDACIRSEANQYSAQIKHTMNLQRVNAWGFESVEIDRDGNCFFNAAIDQLLQYPEIVKIFSENQISLTQEDAHLHLRQKTVNHMLEHWGIYQQFLDVSERKEYLKNMYENGTWAEDVAISAFSKLFQITIVIVYDALQDDIKIMKPQTSKATVYLMKVDDCHYESLRCINLPSFLQSKITAEPSDTLFPSKPSHSQLEPLPTLSSRNIFSKPITSDQKPSSPRPSSGKSCILPPLIIKK